MISVVAIPGAVSIMHSLDVLGDVAGVHVAQLIAFWSVSAFRRTVYLDECGCTVVARFGSGGRC